MDGSPLTRKVAYRDQTVVQGQGHFSKCGLRRAIPPVVCKSYLKIVLNIQNLTVGGIITGDLFCMPMINCSDKGWRILELKNNSPTFLRVLEFFYSLVPVFLSVIQGVFLVYCS